jgi:hypothetical protein
MAVSGERGLEQEIATIIRNIEAGKEVSVLAE